MEGQLLDFLNEQKKKFERTLGEIKRGEYHPAEYTRLPEYWNGRLDEVNDVLNWIKTEKAK